MDSYDEIFFNDESSNLLIYDIKQSSLPAGYALYAAILDQSWSDLGYYDSSKPHHKQSKLFRDSYEWFMTVGEVGPTSFDAISVLFDIDPESIRSLIRRKKFPRGNKPPHLVTHAKSGGLIGGIESSLALKKMIKEDLYAKDNTTSPVTHLGTSFCDRNIGRGTEGQEYDPNDIQYGSLDRCVG